MKFLVLPLLLACALLASATPSLASTTPFTSCATDGEGRELCTPSTSIDPTQLLADYPDLLDDDHNQNKKILCPFLRMMVASGMLKRRKTLASEHVVSQIEKLGVPRDFGESFVSGTIMAQKAKGATPFFQNVLNVENLHRAAWVSHQCGLSFPKYSDEVDPAATAATVAELSSRKDENGQLKIEDFQAVKLAICDGQEVVVSMIGMAEIELLFSFLGGKVRGVVDFADVERVLTGRMPFYIASPELIGADWGVDMEEQNEN